MSTSNASQKSALVLKRLYRSLLKASLPFTKQRQGYPSPVALTCLLHRTGAEDREWQEFLRGSFSDDENDDAIEIEDDDDDDFENDEERAEAHFGKLLREIVTGHISRSSGIRQMNVPSTVDTTRLQTVIRREFRKECTETDVPLRRGLAFRALREIHKKLTFAETLQGQKKQPHHLQQCAQSVHALPVRPPESYLKPGAFLLAHPLLTGYFRRSVICILDHVSSFEEDDDDDAPPVYYTKKSYGTYGLVVNRLTTMDHQSHSNGSIGGSLRTLTLPDILKPLSLPEPMLTAFSTVPVKEGGPVHLSLQMLHSATSETHEELQIGGHLLPTVTLDKENDDIDDGNNKNNDSSTTVVESTAVTTDKAVYYRGSIPAAAKALEDGTLDRQNDVAIFVGCSVWSEGQLESEVERGFWLPCAGPASVALTGICENRDVPDPKDDPAAVAARPETDLWFSMMSALGEEESQLAHLIYRDDGRDENGAPCDER